MGIPSHSVFLVKTRVLDESVFAAVDLNLRASQHFQRNKARKKVGFFSSSNFQAFNQSCGTPKKTKQSQQATW
jgi:hypothetical protein